MFFSLVEKREPLLKLEEGRKDAFLCVIHKLSVVHTRMYGACYY